MTVNVFQNVCSIDGRMRKGTKCPELNEAGLKEGLPPVHRTKTKSLSQLRANVRADKKKSGRKAPRKYDLIPATDAGDHDVEKTLEEVSSKIIAAPSQDHDSEDSFVPPSTSTQRDGENGREQDQGKSKSVSSAE